MFELPPTQLAGMRLQQALMIFRDIWRPVIDTYMRQHFGDVRYVAHLKSLHQSDRVFIDFDAQGVVQLDVSAIIYLLLEDGGLRPPMQSSAPTSKADAPPTSVYVPQMFGFAQEFTHAPPSGAMPLVLPQRYHLYEIRRVRNDWAHQQHVVIKDILKVMKMLITCSNVLPATAPHKQAIREIQLCEAYVRIYEMQQVTIAAQAEESKRHQQSIQQLQHHFDSVSSETLPALVSRIDGLQHDQHLLLSGVMETLADAQQLSEAQVVQLRNELIHLRNLTHDYQLLQQHLTEARQLMSSQHQSMQEMQHQIDALRTIIAAHGIRTSPLLQRSSTEITAKAPIINHVGTESAPMAVVPVHAPWRVLLFVIFAIVYSLILWMQAGIATWIAPYLP